MVLFNSQIKNRINDLEHLPAYYWQAKDIGQFMQYASGFITNFIRRRLTGDPDLAADYYLHFYERAESCLIRFRERQHLPFAAYLATYLRHDFYNYMRAQKRRVIPKNLEADITIFAVRQRSAHSREKGQNRLMQLIESLPQETCLAVKLYHGFELNLSELRLFVEKSPSPAKAADFLASLRHRQKKGQERFNHLRARAAYLNHIMHVSAKEARKPDWNRWKHRIHRLCEHPPKLCTMIELADLLGVSKSTIARRMRHALRAIYSNYREQGWKTTV